MRALNCSSDSAKNFSSSSNSALAEAMKPFIVFLKGSALSLFFTFGIAFFHESIEKQQKKKKEKKKKKKNKIGGYVNDSKIFFQQRYFSSQLRQGHPGRREDRIEFFHELLGFWKLLSYQSGQVHMRNQINLKCNKGGEEEERGGRDFIEIH